MGFGAHEIDQWEPYQFRAAWEGWKSTKVPPKPRAPSEEDYRAAVSRDMARSVH